ncbi:MAG: DUF4349 domain-containing protein [Bacteroidota bacterium]
MTNILSWTAAVVVLALVLSACQAENEASYAPESADLAVEADAFDETGAAPQRASGTVVQASAQIPVPEPAERLLVRTASVRLRAEDHAEVVAQARALARAVGGFVGEEASQRYADRVETTLTLRVPAARFDTLMAALTALDGEVDARSVSVDDVTRQVADVEARLGAKRAAEAQYIELMGRSGSIEDVLAVQARLQQVREEIESAEAQLRAVRDQVSLSTIRLTVFEASAAGITAGPGWFAQAGRAVVNGWNGVLELALGLLSIWPVLLLGGGAVWWLRRRFRPRRAAVPA